MIVIRLKKPIEKAFDCWISNYPESYHLLDIHRFYVFVKTVVRYSKKQKDSFWLRDKIRKCKKTNLEEKNIEYYCRLFENLLDFSKARPLALLSVEKNDSWIDNKYEVKFEPSFTRRKRRKRDRKKEHQ